MQNRTPNLPPLSLFVAMPYTKLGEHAKWTKPQRVADFYGQVRKRVEQKLKRRVEMRIEKDIPKSGLVIGEMFEAIQKADVFIADITGANANVFLELGVRYGVSNKVTILTTQEDSPPPFDINQIGVVRYADGPTQEAEKKIAQIVADEFDRAEFGSPILGLLDSVVVPRRQWELFSGERIRLLIHEARLQKSTARRIEILRDAVEIDPFSLPAQLELMNSLRSSGQLSDALAVNESACRRFPGTASIFKERGRIMDRLSAAGENRLDEAISAFSQALQYNEKDGDLHGCLGGVLRRKALAVGGDAAAALLEQAFHHYLNCMNVDRHSTYAGMNLLRLIMLGVRPRQELAASESQYLNRMFHLCAFEVSDAECRDGKEKWWPMFDLGDILLLRNEWDQAVDKYREAIASIPSESRQDQILPPLRTWKELVESGALRKAVITNAERIIELLEGEISKH